MPVVHPVKKILACSPPVRGDTTVKTILELQDDYSHLVKCAKDITNKADKENRALTEGEVKDTNDYLAQSKAIQKEIKALEADAALRAAVDAEIENLGTPKPRKSTSDKPSDEPLERSPVVSAGWRTGKLVAYKGRDAEANAYKAGQWILASVFGNFAAKRWCEKNLAPQFRGALSEGVATSGGVLVPDEMSQAIIDLRENYGVFRQNARVLPMGRDTLSIPRKSSNITMSFIGEGSTITPNDPAFDQVMLVAKKLGGATLISKELDEDAIISIADMLTRDFAWAMALKEDQCGFTGDGTSTYGGIYGLTKKILDAANTAGAVDCATTGHDTFAEVDNTDLTTLMSKLPAYARMNAKFYCSSVAKSLVFDRLKAVAGGNTVTTLEGRPTDTYLGSPIVVSEVLPTSTGDLNNLPMLFYGDLSLAATMGERRGITVSRDESLYFLTDQIALKATERVDIVVHDLGSTTVAGPVVGLIGFTS